MFTKLFLKKTPPWHNKNHQQKPMGNCANNQNKFQCFSSPSSDSPLNKPPTSKTPSPAKKPSSKLLSLILTKEKRKIHTTTTQIPTPELKKKLVITPTFQKKVTPTVYTVKEEEEEEEKKTTTRSDLAMLRRQFFEAMITEDDSRSKGDSFKKDPYEVKGQKTASIKPVAIPPPPNRVIKTEPTRIPILVNVNLVNSSLAKTPTNPAPKTLSKIPLLIKKTTTVIPPTTTISSQVKKPPLNVKPFYTNFLYDKVFSEKKQGMIIDYHEEEKRDDYPEIHHHEEHHDEEEDFFDDEISDQPALISVDQKNNGGGFDHTLTPTSVSLLSLLSHNSLIEEEILEKKQDDEIHEEEEANTAVLLREIRDQLELLKSTLIKEQLEKEHLLKEIATLKRINAKGS